MHLLKAIALLGIALVAVGCGRKSAQTSAVDYNKVRAMGDFYGAYVADHNGQPPKDEQAFREYLNSKQQELQKAGLTVDEMFKSPRGGELAWVHGKRPPVGTSGMAYLGYEKAPVDGKRLVIGGRGMYEQVNEAEFRRLVPDATKGG